MNEIAIIVTALRERVARLNDEKDGTSRTNLKTIHPFWGPHHANSKIFVAFIRNAYITQ